MFDARAQLLQSDRLTAGFAARVEHMGDHARSQGYLGLLRNPARERHGSDEARTSNFGMMVPLPSDHPDIAPLATGDSACNLTTPY